MTEALQSAMGIDGASDQLQMVRIDAVPYATEVIPYEAARGRRDQEVMRPHRTVTADEEAAISFCCEFAKPDIAAVSPAWVYLRPEALLSRCLNADKGRRLAVSAPSRVVSKAPALTHCVAGASFNDARTNVDSWRFGESAGSTPSLVMQGAKATSDIGASAVVGGAGARLFTHRKLTPSGDTGTGDHESSRPYYFTSQAVA